MKLNFFFFFSLPTNLKVIRSATAPGSTSMLVSKEMHYVFRVLGPAACRDPELFTSVASCILRLTILPPSKRGK